MITADYNSMPSSTIDTKTSPRVIEGANPIWMPKKLSKNEKEKAAREVIKKRPTTMDEFNAICRKHRAKSKSVFKIMQCWIRENGDLVIPYKNNNNK